MLTIDALYTLPLRHAAVDLAFITYDDAKVLKKCDIFCL